tara:strand:+ start:92 stop:325 length:234 start_codon:yes stop_codon:yes gene_type:complete
MFLIDVKNFLKWSLVAISIENPSYTKSTCMKFAIKELQQEKKKRRFIRIQSIKLQEEQPNISKSQSIIQAITIYKSI